MKKKKNISTEKIIVNISGKDYISNTTVISQCSLDPTLYKAVKKDWELSTSLLLGMAERWMQHTKIKSCQLAVNLGNLSVSIGKYGMVPNPPCEVCDEAG